MIRIKRTREKGFALLITVLTVTIILAIGISILNITLKEFILSSTVRDSQMAFYAADAGMECAFYWDYSNAAGAGKFALGGPETSISCLGGLVKEIGGGTHTEIGGNSSGETEQFEMEWGTPTLCTQVSVTKYYSASSNIPMPGDPGEPDCLAGLTCTIVESRGHNRGCDNLDDPRTVERGLRSRY